MEVAVAMFSSIGQYPVRLDDKFRFALPSAIRHNFETGAVLIARQGYVALHTAGQWEEFVLNLRAKLVDGTLSRMHFNAILAGAAPISLDAQGRTVLPPALRAHLNCDRDLVLTGLHDFFGINVPSNQPDGDPSVKEAALAILEESAM